MSSDWYGSIAGEIADEGRQVAKWPNWREMNWMRLNEGPHDRTELPIAPTMKNVTYGGVRYFRMPRSRATKPIRLDGTADLTEYGGAYLWADWMPKPARGRGEDDG